MPCHPGPRVWPAGRDPIVAWSPEMPQEKGGEMIFAWVQPSSNQRAMLCVARNVSQIGGAPIALSAEGWGEVVGLV